jgi:hypothetical protein
MTSHKIKFFFKNYQRTYNRDNQEPNFNSTDIRDRQQEISKPPVQMAGTFGSPKKARAATNKAFGGWVRKFKNQKNRRKIRTMINKQPNKIFQIFRKNWFKKWKPQEHCQNQYRIQ